MNRHDDGSGPARREHRERNRLTLAFAGALLLVVAGCADGPEPDPAGGDDGLYRGEDLVCQNVPAGAEEPTLECSSEEAGVALSVPWQGMLLQVELLPVDDVGEGAAESGFDPIAPAPLLHLRIEDADSGEAVTSFDPPMMLSVQYGANEFDAAEPAVEVGELGLGTWSEEHSSWLVVGHGVFEAGFWVADPRLGQEDLTLEAVPAEGQPRFKISGSEAGGEAVAMIAEAPQSLAPVWGAMPFDMGHMLVGFDPCTTSSDVDLIVDVVECTSTDGAVTVRVPFQEDGSVEPRVVALPWNKDETLLTPSNANGSEFEPQQSTEEPATTLDRSLMNFLVVDADDPQRVLTSFDPPIEYEIVYTPDEIFLSEEEQEEADSQFRVLTVSYWDEFEERLVVLGSGNTMHCFDELTGQLKVGCPWGEPVNAIPTDDENYQRPGMQFFYRMEDAEGNGRAKFFFDRWGDRMVAFGH